MIKPGMIGFSSNQKGTLPKLIRFFTRSNLSHTFVVTEPFLGEPSIQEANELISVVPFEKWYVENDTQLFWIYDVKASPEAKAESLKKIYKEFANTKYGFWQNAWFIYRWFNELVGRDVRKEKNWMSDGVICSELVYWYLWYLGEPFQALLKDWNPDTIQPADIRSIALANPDLFTFVAAKKSA